jgi:hypothetical protein
MYKKAAFLKLRFQTSRGLLSTEQLPDLKMSELAKLCKEQLEVVKKSRGSDDEELAFLDNNVSSDKDNIEALRFDILKDVYLEKKRQKDQAAEDVQKKIELEKLDEIIAKKQNAELESMSVEELMKKREELLKK